MKQTVNKIIGKAVALVLTGFMISAFASCGVQVKSENTTETATDGQIAAPVLESAPPTSSENSFAATIATNDDEPTPDKQNVIVTETPPSSPDQSYVGTWYTDADKLDSMTITAITSDAIQFEMSIFRITTVTARAEIVNGEWIFGENISPDYDGPPLNGTIKFTQNDISVTVNNSEFEYIEAGTAYDFTFRDTPESTTAVNQAYIGQWENGNSASSALNDAPGNLTVNVQTERDGFDYLIFSYTIPYSIKQILNVDFRVEMRVNGGNWITADSENPDYNLDPIFIQFVTGGMTSAFYRNGKQTSLAAEQNSYEFRSCFAIGNQEKSPYSNTVTITEAMQETTEPVTKLINNIPYTPLTADEARVLVTDLWDKFVIVRSYYSNDGLPVNYNAQPVEANGNEYYPVTGNIRTMADLKNITEQTVTTEYAEKNFYADTLDSNMPLYIEKNGILYESAPSGIGYPEEWHFDTLTIKEQSENMLTVAVEEYIWTSDETLVGKISLVKTTGGWRINSID